MRTYDRKELTGSILSVTCCVSPGSCHFLPFIFHRRSTLRFALASLHPPLPPPPSPCCHVGRSGRRLKDQRWHYQILGLFIIQNLYSPFFLHPRTSCQWVLKFQALHFLKALVSKFNRFTTDVDSFSMRVMYRRNCISITCNILNN